MTCLLCLSGAGRRHLSSREQVKPGPDCAGIGEKKRFLDRQVRRSRSKTMFQRCLGSRCRVGGRNEKSPAPPCGGYRALEQRRSNSTGQHRVAVAQELRGTLGLRCGAGSHNGRSLETALINHVRIAPGSLDLRGTAASASQERSKSIDGPGRSVPWQAARRDSRIGREGRRIVEFR